MSDFDTWVKKIATAEKAYEKYHDLIKEIREYYKNTKKNKSNVFWSSIETLKPFIYFKAPKVYVERKEKNSDPIQSAAVSILEKAIEWDLAQFDFDSVIKYARNDYLLNGCGVLFEKYKPTFKTVEQEVFNADGSYEKLTVEALESEYIETLYIDPEKFIADSEKVGIWEDVTWVARIIEMTNKEVVEQFGNDLGKLLDEKELEKNTKIYEIWDKETKTVLYLSKDFYGKILKQDRLPDINGVFPLPKPIYTTQTNDSLIPVPDYTEIKPLLDELSGLNERMRLTMQALKVSGAYDNSFPEVANILNKDVTLVSLSDFDRLREAGGLAGVIDFLPIEQYVSALQAMAQRRADLIQNIYEVTGVSDIMRGNSDPAETATAVTQKTNFGTLRNQDRQNDMQRFITDLLKIKAEMICELFTVDTLASFANGYDPQIVMQAIQFLKTDKIRSLFIGIETDTSFNQDGTQEKAIETVNLIHNLITQAFGVISQQPLLLPLYKQMIESVVLTLPNARQYEPILDEAFNKINQELSQPTPEQPNPEMLKIQQSAQKDQQEYEIKKEQNEIKAGELALKEKIESDKIAMENKEAEMQYDLKQQEIRAGLATSANITTGYVRGF